VAPNIAFKMVGELLRALLLDAFGERLVIDEARLRVVTRRTRHGVVGAEALVVEELVTERDLRGGRHAIGGHRDGVERRRDPDGQVGGDMRE
jgi:hypothetical protein